MSQIDENSLYDAAQAAEKVLQNTIELIDRQYVMGYAKKNPGVVSNVLSIQNTLLRSSNTKDA